VRVGHRRHRTREAGIDLTPMMDMVFLLIIFFMTSARFSQLTRAEVQLPLERGERQQAPQEAGVVVNITRSGDLEVFGRTVTDIELSGIVRQETVRKAHSGEPARFLIRADRDVLAKRLNDVVVVLSSAGVDSARLATEVPR
jgi:biopolymer transport protein ExbD